MKKEMKINEKIPMRMCIVTKEKLPKRTDSHREIK